MKSRKILDQEIDNLVSLLYQIEEKAKLYTANDFTEKSNDKELFSKEAKYLNIFPSNKYSESTNKQD